MAHRSVRCAPTPRRGLGANSFVCVNKAIVPKVGEKFAAIAGMARSVMGGARGGNLPSSIAAGTDAARPGRAFGAGTNPCAGKHRASVM